jgi:hypothetical protein
VPPQPDVVDGLVFLGGHIHPGCILEGEFIVGKVIVESAVGMERKDGRIAADGRRAGIRTSGAALWLGRGRRGIEMGKIRGLAGGRKMVSTLLFCLDHSSRGTIDIAA